jgi:hypothetical protein
MGSRSAHYSAVRRFFAVLVAASVVAGLLAACAPTMPRARPDAIPAGEFGGAFTSASVAATETILARSGIETVATETSTKPLATVIGRSTMIFTTPQVRAFALQAADGGGIRGSALDAATTTSGNVPFSYLLAAWVVKGTSSGAKTIRSLMGEQIWSKAPSVVFPAVALPLFVADVAAAVPHATSESSGVQSATASYRAGSAPRLGIDSPCSTVSNFIQGVLTTVFNELSLTAPSSGSIAGFFVGIWNEALALAQQAIEGLAKTVTGPVVHAIETVAGAVAVVAEVVSYVSPWSVKVTAKPSSVTAGESGSFAGHVDGGTGGADYPSAVMDCANATGITLPKLSAGGSDAVWTLSANVTTTGDTSVILDGDASSTIGFGTTPTKGSGGCSSAPDQTGSGSLTVERPAIDDLRTLTNNLVTTGLGSAGGIAGPLVRSIVKPLLDAILAKLDGLTQASGTGAVAITGKDANGGGDCTTQPTDKSSVPDGTACLVGTWKQTDESTDGASRGGAGVVFTFRADGTGSVNYGGAAPVLSVTGTNPIQYAGSATITYGVPKPGESSGTLTETVVTSSVTATADGTTNSEPAGVTGTLKWACAGGTATLIQALGEGDTLTTEISRSG